MSDLEMEIGRTLGPAAFFIYQYIKHNPGSTQIEMQTGLGLSWCTVRRLLIALEETKVINHTLKVGQSRTREYRENGAKETWKFH
jgi:predicted transcriptional regulator